MNVLMKEFYKRTHNIPHIPDTKFQILDDCYVVITRYWLAKPYKGTIHSVLIDKMSTRTRVEHKYEISIEDIDPDMISDSSILNESGYIIRDESDMYETLEDAQLKCDLLNDEMKDKRNQFIKDLPKLLEFGMFK